MEMHCIFKGTFDKSNLFIQSAVQVFADDKKKEHRLYPMLE